MEDDEQEISGEARSGICCAPSLFLQTLTLHILFLTWNKFNPLNVHHSIEVKRRPHKFFNILRNNLSLLANILKQFTTWYFCTKRKII